MNDLENYFSTLEQSKKLKDLGIIQESRFAIFIETEGPFDQYGEYKIELWNHESIYHCENEYNLKYKEIAAAFNSQELLDLINVKVTDWRARIVKDAGFEYYYAYEDDNIIYWKPLHTFTSEAQSRAEFLIHLIEEKTK